MNINSLPPEIFTAIIRMVVVDTERVGECTIRVNHRKFACLVSVCKLWHSIIVDTPDLWKQFQCTIRPATLRTFLKRSQDAPLSIFRIGYPYTPMPLSIRCVKVLAKELHRIKDAGLLIDDHDWTSASRRLCLEAPMLESFDLRLEKPLERFYETDSDDEDCDDLPIQELPHGIFGGVKPPQLRHLSLQRVKVSWSSPLLSSLTTLKLHSQDRPSYSEFATVLGNMPCLAILGLHSCLPEDGPAVSRLPSHTPLSLPRLRRLTLSESNSNLCRWFMEHGCLC
ncbi:hypothetical protein ONZ45_g18108 [Pleurotus djamor]|nr:hypothetical protein ONZ45_g18108 [Pleurotus djamor]